MPAQKTIVVTGGTSGIGYYTALALASDPSRPRVIVTGRDAERAARSVEEIKAASKNPDIEYATGDLASLEATDVLARDLLERFATIDVLVNNAGMLTQTYQTTADDIEKDFAVNVIAPWRLTHALLPALERADDARVINVTGGMPNDSLRPDALFDEQGFVALPHYSHTKRAMEAMSLELAEQMRQKGVHVNVVYPGAASTHMTGAMTAAALPWYMKPVWPMFSWFMQRDDGGKSARKASRSSVWAATAPELQGVAGRYYDTKCREAKLDASVRDQANRARVISLIEELTA